MLLRYAATAFLAASLFIGTASAQHAVSPYQRYHRLICLVHLTGTGTEADPIRPEYAPEPNAAASRAGIIAYSFQLTDDKRMAIVQYVAADRAAFKAILADKRPEVRVFEIGKDNRGLIEAALKIHLTGFNLDSLRLPVQ